MGAARRPLDVTSIGEFVRHRSCERRFRLAEIGEKELAAELPFFSRYATVSLDPVLKEQGRKREEQWEQSLVERGFAKIEIDEATSWRDFAALAAQLEPGRPAYCREVAIAAPVGDFLLQGRVDFVLLYWRDGRPVVRLVECKASRRDQTYHRVQVATYRRMLRELLASYPFVLGGAELKLDDFEVCVVRVEKESNSAQDMLAVAALDAETLDVLEADVERLLAADGPFQRILATELDQLEYQLDDRCNSCFFAVHCFPESARQRRLELLSLSPAEIRALKAVGVDDLSALAALDLDSAAAVALRRVPGMALDLTVLRSRAAARLATLPQAPPGALQVEAVRPPEASLLPEHEHDGLPLIRVYLAVDYDYSENRLGALSAHVTSSDHFLVTARKEQKKGVKGAREVTLLERRFADGKAISRELSLRQSRDVVSLVKKPGWSGEFAADCALERELLEDFFGRVLDAVESVAQGLPAAPLHFYAWEQDDVRRLTDACLRLDPGGADLLRSWHSLFSSRGHEEQVIFTPLSDEMSRRFATGFTGTGPLVAAALDWSRNGKYPDRFWWDRKLLGPQPKAMVDMFSQDLFDFTAWLHLKDGQWATMGGHESGALFEIRGRFHQSLTAPYLRAYWGELKQPPPGGDADEESKRLRQAITKYSTAGRAPKLLETFLAARVQALRWLEERMKPKNRSIEKPAVDLSRLRQFSIEVEGVAGAALDFLRLDHHVKLTDWLAAHLGAPATRVSLGRSLPVKDAHAAGAGVVSAWIDAERAGRPLEELRQSTNLAAGSFIRLTPTDGDLDQGQTVRQLLFGGKTAVIEQIDWTTGEVQLAARYERGQQYKLYSGPVKEDWSGFEFATMDESPSDFVAGTVEKRLREQAESPIMAWLDPQSPALPRQEALEPQLAAALAELAASAFIPGPDGPLTLAPDQRAAALDGLAARVQLLQGPPGTGKTQTTAAAVLLRTLARCSPGDVVLLAANTHTAVDTLLERIQRIEDGFAAAAAEQGLELPPLTLGKIEAREAPPAGIEPVPVKGSKTWAKEHRDSVLILGGTTNGVLRLANELDGSATFPAGLKAQVLVVDEASMIVFPHLLAIATVMADDGELMLAGDHRQLAPIVAHDWEREDRAPVVAYTPFASAYDAVRSLALQIGDEACVQQRQLNFTFRLPPEIRRLISAVYRKDEIELAGREGSATQTAQSLADVWSQGGVYLVVHDERESQQANETEAALVTALLDAAPELAPRSVGLVTPHRAQRALLKDRLGDYYGDERPVDVVDTVERLQGGERETVIFSACASDPAAISARAEFLLDLNRANVAFSRSKERLIVVVSQSLLDHVPADLELYEAALLWKTLRAQCRQPVCELTVGGQRARVLTVAPTAAAPVEAA